MLKYAKIINNELGLCEVGTGINSAFYQKIDMELMDVEQGYDGNWYLVGYTPVEPEPTTEKLAEQVRAERDARITACDWIITRHRDEIDEGSSTTLSMSEYASCLAYRKALRDLPSLEDFPWDGGGEDTPWPTAPSEM